LHEAFAISKPLLKEFEKELEPFKVSGNTIRFTVSKPIPVTLVKMIVKARMKENEEKAAAKKIKAGAAKKGAGKTVAKHLAK